MNSEKKAVDNIVDAIFRALTQNPRTVRRVQQILIFTFIALIIFDLFLAILPPEGDTISQIIQRSTEEGLFVLCYLWGVLGSHFFLAHKGKKLLPELLGVTLILAIAVLIFFLDNRSLIDFETTAGNQLQLMYLVDLLTGLVLGRLFWPQRYPHLGKKN
ncbi:hypothetical protein [Croceiramulus getboli]|nr:hypothetical protein P8624_10980 [Flavobacteriaceae bacterium YJPT1-3]